MNLTDKLIASAILTLTLIWPVSAAQYVYDDLNRLIQVHYDSGKIIEYTYDPAGNLLKITTTGLPTYTIEGLVTDPKGLPLAEVLITINEHHTQTDNNGYYQLPNLPAGDYTLVATNDSHNFTPKLITVHEDQPNLINIISDGLTACLLYAVHDERKQDTQFFTIDPAHNFTVKLLGQLHLAKDIEALDMHPETNQLLAAAGDDGTPPGMLYTVNTRTGELSPVNETGTGFAEINGLSFNPDGSLWAAAEGDGLIIIDPQTGLGTLQLAYAGPVEDITWDNQGLMLYGIQTNQLFRYNRQTSDLTQLNCSIPGGKVEALEMLPDGRLLFAIHEDKTQSIHALDLDTCQLIGTPIETRVDGLKLNDIEGLAWPLDACSP